MVVELCAAKTAKSSIVVVEDLCEFTDVLPERSFRRCKFREYSYFLVQLRFFKFQMQLLIIVSGGHLEFS